MAGGVGERPYRTKRSFCCQDDLITFSFIIFFFLGLANWFTLAVRPVRAAGAAAARPLVGREDGIGTGRWAQCSQRENI